MKNRCRKNYRRRHLIFDLFRAFPAFSSGGFGNGGDGNGGNEGHVADCFVVAFRQDADGGEVTHSQDAVAREV